MNKKEKDTKRKGRDGEREMHGTHIITHNFVGRCACMWAHFICPFFMNASNERWEC
jgi:hypothetical protein